MDLILATQSQWLALQVPMMEKRGIFRQTNISPLEMGHLSWQLPSKLAGFFPASELLVYRSVMLSWWPGSFNPWQGQWNCTVCLEGGVCPETQGSSLAVSVAAVPCSISTTPWPPRRTKRQGPHSRMRLPLPCPCGYECSWASSYHLLRCIIV